VPDYSEVLESFRRSAAAPDHLVEHRAAQLVVSLRMERLERLDEWATFIAHVEALVQRDEAALAVVRERIETGMLTPAELTVFARQAYGLRCRIDALRLVLTLPADLQACAKTTP